MDSSPSWAATTSKVSAPLSAPPSLPDLPRFHHHTRARDGPLPRRPPSIGRVRRVLRGGLAVVLPARGLPRARRLPGPAVAGTAGALPRLARDAPSLAPDPPETRRCARSPFARVGRRVPGRNRRGVRAGPPAPRAAPRAAALLGLRRPRAETMPLPDPPGLRGRVGGGPRAAPRARAALPPPPLPPHPGRAVRAPPVRPGPAAPIAPLIPRPNPRPHRSRRARPPGPRDHRHALRPAPGPARRGRRRRVPGLPRQNPHPHLQEARPARGAGTPPRVPAPRGGPGAGTAAGGTGAEHARDADPGRRPGGAEREGGGDEHAVEHGSVRVVRPEARVGQGAQGEAGHLPRLLRDAREGAGGSQPQARPGRPSVGRGAGRGDGRGHGRAAPRRTRGKGRRAGVLEADGRGAGGDRAAGGWAGGVGPGAGHRQLEVRNPADAGSGLHRPRGERGRGCRIGTAGLRSTGFRARFSEGPGSR
ncbi:hypothetical protein DFJ74DRAFT_739430 [Hyaloraphidium curvatum]|nr:hypothetical protein DFJ74DRAFT_739430 [Hyaloraphidium curvatum]